MRVPSTQALRAFQLAAQTLSFKRAARQLCLTPSAVSHRIKGLEALVGVALFERGPRTLKLTSAGAAYAGEVTAAFRRLDLATRELRSRLARRALRLRVAPFFASEFLLPRLGGAVPFAFEMDIDVNTGGDMEGGDEDVSILLAQAPQNDPRAVPLFQQSYVPACAPALLARAPPRANPLQGQALLVHRTREDAWERWADAAGLEPPRPRQRISFDTMTEIVQAAERGVGIGLVPMPLASARVRAGSLLPLSNQPLHTDESYVLRHRGDAAPAREVCTFREWLLREVCSVSAPA